MLAGLPRGRPASIGARRSLAGTDRFAARVFNLAVIALLGYFLLRIFRPFYGPILWAFLLAFLLFPLNERLRRRLKGRRGLAATLLTVAVAIGIAVPVVVGSVAFAKQTVDLAQRLGDFAESHRIEGFEDVLRLPLIGTVMSWLEAHTAVTSDQLQEWAAEAAQSAVQFLLVRGRTALFGALGLLGDLTLTLFVFFFFLRDGDAMAARVKRLIPLEERRKASLDRHLQDVTHAVVFGTVVTALVQGSLIGVAFWITGLRSPVVFGVLATVASFIPFVGTGLDLGPGGDLPVLQGRRREGDLHGGLGRPRRRQRRQLPPAGARLGEGRDGHAHGVLRRARGTRGLRVRRTVSRTGGPGPRAGADAVRGGGSAPRGRYFLTQSATKMLVSCGFWPLRLLANTSVFPSRVNIGKPSKSGL